MDWYQVLVIVAPIIIVLGTIAYQLGMQRQELKGLKEDVSTDLKDIKSNMKADKAATAEVTMEITRVLGSHESQLARMNGFSKGKEAHKKSSDSGGS